MAIHRSGPSSVATARFLLLSAALILVLIAAIAPRLFGDAEQQGAPEIRVAEPTEVSQLVPRIGDYFSVRVNRTVQGVHRIWPLSSKGKLNIDSLKPPPTKVVIEIGTNDKPESISVLVRNRDTVLIAFEPRPDAFRAMVDGFPPGLSSRLIAIPAAVAPVEASAFAPMNIGGHRGCSSLLQQSSKLHHFAEHERKHARKRSQATQLRTVAWCAMSEAVTEVAVVSLALIMPLIPDDILIPYIMTDAQGFDTSVISTLPSSAALRVGYIILECQDLPQSELALLLVQGALTCAEQQVCVERWFPHRLEYCWFNAPKVRELNCMYGNPNAAGEVGLHPPRGLQVVGSHLNITYPARPGAAWSCPKRL